MLREKKWNYTKCSTKITRGRKSVENKNRNKKKSK